MKKLVSIGFLAAAMCAQTLDHPTGPRMTPPTVNSVTPAGFARGMTVEMTVEGLNLAKASAIYFSESGVTGKILRVKELPDLPDIRLGSNGTPSTIDVGPLPPRNQVTVELDISPEANVGPVKFRLLTPLGTSPEGAFVIEPYYGESPDREPNDSFDNAFETFLPTVLVGAISRPGDADHFKISVKAGEELVFVNSSSDIGSTLSPVVRILDANQRVLGEYGSDGGRTTERFAHRFEKEGTYYIRVADYEQGGRASHTYRLIVGKLPVMLSAFPLGVRRGQEAEVAVQGFNLGKPAIKVKGEPSPDRERAVTVRPETPNGAAFSELMLAIGDDPEVQSAGTNTKLAAAQALTLPVTVNGKVAGDSAQYFRFAAKKGQKVVLEVNARRLGSLLDSVVEVLDAKGQPIERAVARATWETFLVLRDHDSVQRGLRIQAWNVLNVGDYVMVGNEICRVEEVPDGPDEDMLVEAFGGQRYAFFGTTSEAHGVDRAVYKVDMHPPGAQFTPNGLPLVRFYYRNDDGGPGYGKDSLLEFTAPADGEYVAMLRDVRGFGGEDYAYRLSLREPRPDFRLSINPRNPNVPRGGSIPVTVTAFRQEGFSEPIEIAALNLPAGITAAKSTIARNADSATIVLTAAADAKLDDAAPFEIEGRAGKLVHKANPEDALKRIALAPKPDVVFFAETKEVELAPGETAEVTVSVKRQNGFAGRIPVVVSDLPARVRVTDSGLNGVLLNEDEDRRSFTIWALPNAEPVEGNISVAGRIETRSPQQNAYAATETIRVRVKPAPVKAAVAAAASPEKSTAPK
jgi:hypothetical protein